MLIRKLQRYNDFSSVMQLICKVIGFKKSVLRAQTHANLIIMAKDREN